MIFGWSMLMSISFSLVRFFIFWFYSNFDEKIKLLLYLCYKLLVQSLHCIYFICQLKLCSVYLAVGATAQFLIKLKIFKADFTEINLWELWFWAMLLLFNRHYDVRLRCIYLLRSFERLSLKWDSKYECSEILMLNNYLFDLVLKTTESDFLMLYWTWSSWRTCALIALLGYY